ncbi:unnamed protein product [Camellia sinensis]
MPPSPVMRCSLVRELQGDNHRRGRSLEGEILLREKNDDLALFNEMETRERDSFLLPSNDDLKIHSISFHSIEIGFCGFLLLVSMEFRVLLFPLV